MAKIIRREWTSRGGLLWTRSTSEGRQHDEALRQFIQQLIGVKLDKVSILRRERVPALQQGINSFAGVDEIRNFFSNKRHGGSPRPLAG